MKIAIKLLPVCLLLAALLFIVVSRKERERKLEQGLLELQKNPVVLSFDGMACLTDSTFLSLHADEEVEYTMIVYVDSTECSQCTIKRLTLWNADIDEINRAGRRVRNVFVFSPSTEEIENVRSSIVANKLRGEVYLDTANVFSEKNAQFLKDRRFHTMLLGRDNRVVMVGDPTTNRKINDLYKRTLESN